MKLRGKRFDVLYSLEMTRFLQFLALFVRPGGRILYNRAGMPADPSEHIDANIIKLLDAIIVESPFQANAAKQIYGQDVPVASLPLLGHICTPMPRAKPLSDEPLNIAFLGRYDEKKGIYRLLDIWPELEIGPARLHYHGHGPEQDHLKESIKRRGLEGEVIVNGGWKSASELGVILSKTDLLVLPSEEEGLPLILLEAMAHGVPFVASDVGAIPTLAEDNPDVRVVSLDNTSIKEAIEERAQTIRTGGIEASRLQAYFQSRYSYDVLSTRWSDILLKAH
jgi:glycosyltransferase involved in cell wall biosynthesis